MTVVKQEQTTNHTFPRDNTGTSRKSRHVVNVYGVSLELIRRKPQSTASVDLRDNGAYAMLLHKQALDLSINM
jgi:hypothetical protein